MNFFDFSLQKKNGGNGVVLTLSCRSPTSTSTTTCELERWLSKTLQSYSVNVSGVKADQRRSNLYSATLHLGECQRSVADTVTSEILQTLKDTEPEGVDFF